jgi:hypothetical protein
VEFVEPVPPAPRRRKLEIWIGVCLLAVTFAVIGLVVLAAPAASASGGCGGG